MIRAQLTIDPTFRVGAVDSRLFGSFAEHMGRCVYTGLYEPDHPSATELGFRGDVLDLVEELGVSVVRYPGGNFVSGYHWEDGVGPQEERPRRLDLAWRAIEPNAFGVDEFAAWCATAGVEPMMAVNLGTRGVAAAAELLEYCNHPEGTELSDLRRANGAKEPHDIKVWCLGNEMDGPWQIGHKTAAEYGRVAAEAARAMRRLDPTVELVACGSSNTGMPTFASWEATVLAECYDAVDHVSLHNYYDPTAGDLGDFLASGMDLDRAISAVVATADHVGARLGSRRRLKVAVDEWNVWYQSRFHGEDSLEWAEHRALIEDTYDVADAVVVGSLLVTLLRHADRVGIACQAQLVNVIAPIRTDARRPGVAADDLPPVRPGRGAGAGRGPAGRAPGAGLRQRRARRRAAARRHRDVRRGERGGDPLRGEPVRRRRPRARGRPARTARPAAWRPPPRWPVPTATSAPPTPPTGPTRSGRRTNPRVRLGRRRLTAVLPPVSWNVVRLLPDQTTTPHRPSVLRRTHAQQPLHQPPVRALPARVPRRHGGQPAGRGLRQGARLGRPGRRWLHRQGLRRPEAEPGLLERLHRR